MHTERNQLDSIEPSDAQELYLKYKATEVTDKTLRTHKYRTNYFVQWCEEQGIDDMNDVTGRHLQEYRLWREEDGDLAQISLNQQMATIRVFLQWCASIEAVPADLYEKVMVPRVSPEQQRREEMLEAETAEAILDHLSTFSYASVEHAVIAVLWETGIRLGAANSLNVTDVDVEDERIELAHRPEQDTQLKNAQGGERPIAITPGLAGLLEDYIEHTRHDVMDDYGHRPLFATTRGRMHRTTLRGVVYRATAPCFRNEPCPDCTRTADKKCGEAVSPHAIRRGSITHYLTEDVPVEVIGDRIDVSRDVLDKHYDKRSEDVKLEQRRGYLENL
jgi:site-specific recombinase XerD